jgi:hypothetical protein
MSIRFRMTARARHGHSPRLGRCLARLQSLDCEGPESMQLRIERQAKDPLIWQVGGRWSSLASQEAFLHGEPLRRILAEALSEGLIASLECVGQTPRKRI